MTPPAAAAEFTPDPPETVADVEALAQASGRLVADLLDRVMRLEAELAEQQHPMGRFFLCRPSGTNGAWNEVMPVGTALATLDGGRNYAGGSSIADGALMGRGGTIGVLEMRGSPTNYVYVPITAGLEVMNNGTSVLTGGGLPAFINLPAATGSYNVFRFTATTIASLQGVNFGLVTNVADYAVVQVVSNRAAIDFPRLT